MSKDLRGQQYLPSFTEVTFVYPEGEKKRSSISRLCTALIRTSPQILLGQLTYLGTFLIKKKNKKKNVSTKPQWLPTQSPAGFLPGIRLITSTWRPRCKSVPIRPHVWNPEEIRDQSGGRSERRSLLAAFGCCCLKSSCPYLIHQIKSQSN